MTDGVVCDVKEWLCRLRDQDRFSGIFEFEYHNVQMTRTVYSLTLILILTHISHTSHSQQDGSKATRYKIEAGLEYLFPTKDHRSIQTVSLNVLGGAEFFKKMPLSVYGGVTATYVWETIVQWDDNFNDITYENNAFGIGPVFLIRYEPFIYAGFSVAPEFSGGIIFYSHDFPAGGDFYNFMWRLGGSINYRMKNNKYSFNLNVKWMHVSNGQGLGPQNPSYEGKSEPDG